VAYRIICLGLLVIILYNNLALITARKNKYHKCNEGLSHTLGGKDKRRIGEFNLCTYFGKKPKLFFLTYN
jgi:hypothetical protein